MNEEEGVSCASSRQELSQQRPKAQGEVGENTSSSRSVINHRKRSEPSTTSTGNGDHHRHRARGGRVLLRLFHPAPSSGRAAAKF